VERAAQQVAEAAESEKQQTAEADAEPDIPSDAVPNRDDDAYRGRRYPGETRRQTQINFELARRSCMAFAQDEAVDRNFYSARYDGTPHLYRGDGPELRGRMRLEDRRGYLLVDSVCEVDDEGIAQRFAFLR
jgi:hypothetical protein